MTLDGPERGLLCLRVRDEIRMTIDAYKTLYDSSVTFGVKKQLQAEQGMAEMEDQVKAIFNSTDVCIRGRMGSPSEYCVPTFREWLRGFGLLIAGCTAYTHARARALEPQHYHQF